MIDAATELGPRSEFIHAMNARMANVQNLEGTFTAPVWKLWNEYWGARDCLTFDWSQFETEMARREGTAISFQGQRVDLTSTELAKFALFESRVGDSRRLWNVSFNALHMIFCYLNSEGADQVTKRNIKDFYGQTLTMRPGALGWIRRAQCPAYGTAVKRLHELAALMNRHDIKKAFVDVTKRDDDRAFRAAVEENTGQTVADYEAGGSFNFLGIDAGKHFVDHCGDWFRENYRYALALSIAHKSTATRGIQRWGLAGSRQKPLTRYLAAVLCGRPDKIPRPLARTIVPVAKGMALDTFIDVFNKVGTLCTATSLPVIEQVIESAGLPACQLDAEEFVRSFMVSLYSSESPVTPEFVFTQYRHTIEETGFAFSSTYETFLETCEKIVRDHQFQLKSHDQALTYLTAKREDLLDPGKLSRSQESGRRRLRITPLDERTIDLRAIVDLVPCFGEIFCVGLTGWRASEYGFPMSAIKIEPNNDLIDSAYIPVRYHVRWSPYKTHQGMQVDREITTDVFVMLSLLNELRKVSNGFGPLVRGPNKPTPKISADRITVSIKQVWPHFVTKYKLFTELDRQESEGELCKHLCSTDTREVLELRDNTRKNLLAYRLSNTVAFTPQDWIRAYRNDAIEPSLREAIDDVLTKEVLAIIESNEELTKADSAFISSQLLQNAKYPSPHALRHCWAEAVFRRYSGDVGKFIRANFKHLNARFFMAYLRDKDASKIYQMAKRETINSTVRRHLRAMLDENRAYGGHFDAFLSKTIGLLNVLPYKELSALAQADHEQVDATLSELADKISSERIIEFKGNPWANCLLRVNTQKAAKCSVKGEPQRHLAAPDRCLGCINGDVQSAHFDYIVIYYADTLQALADPDFPIDIKKQMLPSVIDLKKAITSLARNSGEDGHKKYLSALNELIVDVQAEISGVAA